MPYCRECGAELDEDAKFCPSCGTPAAELERGLETEGRRSGAVRILLLIFGSIVLLAGFALVVGGGALIWVNTALTDNEGFLSTESRQLETDSYAIVLKRVNIHFGDGIDLGVGSSDIVTIKLTAFSNDPSKNVFIGIAEESDANAYLSRVKYEEISRLRMQGNPLQGFSFSEEYSTHSGNASPDDPASQTFWTVSEYGAGTQTLEWSPETGRYWIILMNEDGSAGVDLTVKAGVRVSLFSMIALGFLVGGVIALIIGGVMVYYGVRR